MEATVPKAKYDELEARFNALEYQFAQLIKLINGSKSERFVPTSIDANQLELFASEQADVPSQKQRETIEYNRSKPGARPDVRKLPDHLPVEEYILEPEADVTGLSCIGQEVTDTIDYRPGQLVIIRRIRPKYAKPIIAEDGSAATDVLIAQLPSRPIERGLAEANLLAQIVVDKLVDHLPLDRQAKRYLRDFGWKVSTSTLGDWFAAVCSLLKILYDDWIQVVLSTDYLQVDESTIKVLDKTKAGETHLGYQWVYRNPANGLILFVYQKGRGAEGLMKHLHNFKGYLQTDGYQAYVTYLGKHPEVKAVSCGAHIRRYFFDALSNNRAGAEHFLSEIQKLYTIEAHCRKHRRTPTQRLELRRRAGTKVYDKLLEFVKRERASNLSKGAYGKALHYAHTQLPKLALIFEDGRIELDNNLIENSIRPLALGRKNYLFAGSHQGAQNLAMMYSFLGSCKQLGVNPREWLADVLTRIQDHPRNQLRNLMPDRWKSRQEI